MSRHPLNLSDHLPLNVKLDYKPQQITHHTNTTKKMNWRKASSIANIEDYRNVVSSNITPFLKHPLVSIAEVYQEIASVTSLLHQAASATIPSIRCKLHVKNFVQDQELKQKCQASKSAWRFWHNENWPRSGPIYQQMKTARNEVKAHVRKCRAQQERKAIQARDYMFRTKDERRFDTCRRNTECRRLIVNVTLVTDDDELRTCWMNSFANLAQSQTAKSELNQEENNTANMEAMSYGFDDLVLDCCINTEEIDSALWKLKTRRSGGADGLLAEHLKNGGPTLIVWLKCNFNTIIHLEQIPSSFKLGMIVQVHKGKGTGPTSL